MNAFSVISSFSSATRGNEEIIYADQSETEGTGSSGYFSPSMDNGVLAPYNFNFS